MSEIILPIKNSDKNYHLHPSKILCLGLNYAEHVKEHDIEHASNQYKEPPKEPLLFPKTPNCLIGPEQPITIPKVLEETSYPRVDYEGELALIINQRCKNISKDHYMDYIFGFCCFNDVTARDLQRHDINSKKPWFKSKSLDTFGPIGPLIVRPDDIDNVQNLKLETQLNGKIVQKANTRDMVFNIAEILEYITKYFTLEEGDMVVTGTPSGIGPIQKGDTVEVEIEQIGTLSNPVQ